jgi:hypothetical protein
VQHLHPHHVEHEGDPAAPRSSRPALTGLQSAMLTMQRTAGNVATTHAITVSRSPLTAAEKTPNLTSARYAGQRTLEAAYDNSPPLSHGIKGSGVAAVQQGLVDSVFGNETLAPSRRSRARTAGPGWSGGPQNHGPAGRTGRWQGGRSTRDRQGRGLDR